MSALASPVRRPAVLADLPGLLALEEAAFGADAWSEASWRSELAQTPGTRWVVAAEAHGAIVGFGLLMVVGEVADVQRIAVARTSRRKGLGRVLLGELLAEASRRRCERLLLEVAADNLAARALYTAAGFVEISRRRAYYGAGGDALVLQRLVPRSDG